MRSAAGRNARSDVAAILNSADDDAGNLGLGRSVTPAAPRRPFNRNRQRPEWADRYDLQMAQAGTSRH
jgi:hypothetical protein